jgi:hypothetical protein
VRALQAQIAETQSESRALRAEIAHLESPGHVEHLAQEHLDVSVGSESTALPQSQIGSRLPPPRTPHPAHP